MKINKIKLLAKLAGNNKTISKEVESFVLNLKRSDLKIFLNNYKNTLQKNRAYVTTASQLPNDLEKKLSQIFKDKQLITNIDRNVGAGIKILQNDTVIDFTFKRYINDTIEMLK